MNKRSGFNDYHPLKGDYIEDKAISQFMHYLQNHAYDIASATMANYIGDAGLDTFSEHPTFKRVDENEKGPADYV